MNFEKFIGKLLKHNVFVERKIKAMKDSFVALAVPIKKDAKTLFL